MNYLITLAATAVIAGAGLPAQGGLLFTCRNQSGTFEQTLNIKPASLRRIDNEDISVVVPQAGAMVSARKFGVHDAFTTLVGDEDNDAAIWENPLFRHTDALLWRQKSSGRSMREVYVSTSQAVGGFVNASGAASTADIFRVVPNGQFRFFLRESQIKAAFNIPATVALNVDAITVDWSERLIYLSFENTQTVTVYNAAVPLVLTARDGAILALRVAGWGEPVTLMPMAGLMVATETEVDGMVAASAIRNRNNVVVGPAVVDVDGLHLSTRIGFFQNNWGVWSNLMFSAETLTGAGIVNTLGQIEMINGVQMGSSIGPSTGAHVGLLSTPPIKAESLNGLHLRDANLICPFVLETPRPEVHGIGVAQVDIEGLFGPGAAVLFFDLYTMPVHPFNSTFAPLSNACFPDTMLYTPWPWPYVIVPLDPQGIGTFSAPINVPLKVKVVFQALQGMPMGGIRLSAPLAIELYPD